jgi:hypothetical protein
MVIYLVLLGIELCLALGFSSADLSLDFLELAELSLGALKRAKTSLAETLSTLFAHLHNVEQTEFVGSKTTDLVNEVLDKDRALGLCLLVSDMTWHILLA